VITGQKVAEILEDLKQRRLNKMDIPFYNDPVKNTFEVFCKSGFDYGDVINKEWFMKNFHLTEPKTAKDVRETDVLYMKYMGYLRALLLREKKMALKSKPGIGQEIVKPADQTKWAMNDVRNVISKELEKACDRLVNVNHELLSDIERKENSDAEAKLSFFTRNSMKRLTW
jgi:hypothetical protein